VDVKVLLADGWSDGAELLLGEQSELRDF